jgi:type VI protein secretion system component VasF
MTPNSQPLTTTENPYAAQRPTRKITWKVIFYVFFALAWIAFFVFSILNTSHTKDWFWECLTFAVSIGGAIVSTIYARQSRARQAQTLAGTASSPRTSQLSVLTTLYGALALIALVMFVVLMFNGNPLGKELFTSLVAGSGVTWGFELAHRETRDPITPGPYSNRQGNYD